MRKILALGIIVLAMLALTAASPSPISAAGPTSYHVVHHGDTMYSIASHYGVSSWALAQANQVWNPNNIYAGQVLFVPCAGCYYPKPTPCPWPGYCPGPNPNPRPYPNPYPYPNPRPYPNPYPNPYPYPGPINHCMYQVRWGDTMSGIAARYGVNAWSLAQSNGIYNMNWIYAGQMLRLPGCYL
jgi:LysM repeat protein